MDRSRRRSLAIAANSLLAACLVFVVSSPARTSATGASCAELRAWAGNYSNASLTLDDLTSFTRAQRVAIFNAVTPTVRAELWREHLRRFATRADLNDTQRTFILQARAELSAASYTDRDPALRRAESQKFWTSAAPLFPLAEHRRAWFILGELTTRATATAARGDSTIALNLAQAPPCNCNNDDGWLVCATGVCGGPPCHSVWACGLFGGERCDGWCVLA